MLCVSYWRERLLRQEFADEIKLQEEKEAFKAQLLSFTSMEAISRSKDRGRSIADVFGEVTVLFCDIVDFTVLAERIAPKHLVELLSNVFLRLDELAAEHHVEKVKTIGDAYMAISGVSDEARNSAEDMANFALSLIEETSTLSEAVGYPIQFRVGMHTGSLIGGVIGRQKMSYDYWGRTFPDTRREPMLRPIRKPECATRLASTRTLPIPRQACGPSSWSLSPAPSGVTVNETLP
jgi:hypothetical protein